MRRRHWSDAGQGAAAGTDRGIGWTSLPWLFLLRQPTLILHGDDDPLVLLVNAKIMHRLIPHSQLYIFHDGHLGLGTSPQELSQVVNRFLTAPASSAASA